MNIGPRIKLALLLTILFGRVAVAQYVNVTTLGVSGGGSDETSAIQAALNTVTSYGSSTLYFPQGTYGISSPLTIPDGVKILCSGPNIDSPQYSAVFKPLAGSITM